MIGNSHSLPVQTQINSTGSPQSASSRTPTTSTHSQSSTSFLNKDVKFLENILTSDNGKFNPSDIKAQLKVIQNNLHAADGDTVSMLLQYAAGLHKNPKAQAAVMNTMGKALENILENLEKTTRDGEVTHEMLRSHVPQIDTILSQLAKFETASDTRGPEKRMLAMAAGEAVTIGTMLPALRACFMRLALFIQPKEKWKECLARRQPTKWYSAPSVSQR